MSVAIVLGVLGAVFLTLLIVFVAYWIYLSRTHYWVDKNIPFESPIPFLGIISEFIKGKSIQRIDQELYLKHGRVFGVYGGTKPYLFVADPELVKHVLVKDFNNFPHRQLIETNMPLFDNMIGLASGDQWRNIRNIISPAFSPGKITSMIPVISECAETSRKVFVKYASDGEVVDCRKACGCFALDVIAIIVFGTTVDSHNEPTNVFAVQASKIIDFKVNIKSIVSFLFPRVAKLFGWTLFPMEPFDYLKETVNSLIRKREENNEVKPDFLQVMMDSQKGIQHSEEAEADMAATERVDQTKRKPLTHDEALAQGVMFFVAGYGFTNITMSMICYYLALDQDVQKKVLEEVDHIWENRTSLDQEALHEATYIEAVIDETLRINTPYIRLDRTAENDCVLGDADIRIPIKKGMHVVVPLYAMHHDLEFFPEPEKFKPERFIPKGNSDVKLYTYLPFGAGPRNCFAMRFALLEIKICLLHILKSVKFSTSPKTLIPMKYTRRVDGLVPKAVTLKVTLR